MVTARTALFALLILLCGGIAHAQINVSTNLITPTVELVWEAHSHIPPLYRGKALYPISGEVTVIALPPASLGDPASLTYTWKRNGTVDGDNSGVGKTSYTFTGSEFGDTPLIVAQVSNGKQTVHGVLRLTYHSPVIRFYENRPLEGIAFERALRGEVSANADGITIEAYPFFAGEESRRSPLLEYFWSSNGRRLYDAVEPAIAVQSEVPATASLQLSVGHLTHILQRSTASLSVIIEE